MRRFNRFMVTCAAAGMLAPTTAMSAQIFADGFDNLGNWVLSNQPDTSTAIIDYSSLGIGEAPNMVAGSAATTGVIFRANEANGAAAAANLIGSASGGNADLALTTYQVQFDMWLNVAIPVPSGGTEQGVFGVGRTTLDPLGRNNRSTNGDGTWGWLATENGYGTEDTAIFINTVEQADLGDTQAGESDPFNDAFTNHTGGVNAEPALEWVRVTMAVDNGNVQYWYNDTLFFDIASTATNGDVMIGYEDPFSSLSGSPDDQFGVFDNVIISDQITIPEPASASLLGLAALALLRRRR